jgi:mannose-6-phosphate isomerase-like protein (cupin superfamily)
MSTIPTAPALVSRGADAETLRFPNGSMMWLLAECVGTTATMSAHRSLMRAGAQGAQPHHHEHTTHVLFIVSGSLDLMLDDRVSRLDAGDVAVIPPGVSHAFRATPDSDADVFDVVTPGRSFDMFRGYDGVSTDRDTGPTIDPDTYADDSPTWEEFTTTIGGPR